MKSRVEVLCMFTVLGILLAFAVTKIRYVNDFS